MKIAEKVAPVRVNSLELVDAHLPFSSFSNLYPDLDRFIDILSSTLIIDAQLQDVTVLDRSSGKGTMRLIKCLP